MNQFLPISILVFLFTSISSIRAEDPIKGSQVPPIMYRFLGEMIGLEPFMFSENKFVDKANAAEIGSHIKNLVELSKHLPDHSRLHSPTFKISADMIKGHLARLEEAYAKDRKPFARRLLVATLDGCSSCHSQVPKMKSANFEWKVDLDQLKGSHFDKAEFLFAIRRYDQALQNYDEFLQNAKKESPESFQVETALRRKLFIFVRARQDPRQGIEELKKDARSKEIPKRLVKQINGWIDALKGMSKGEPKVEDAASLEALASASIPSYLQADLDDKPQGLVTILRASGLIYHFMNTHPASDMTPGLFYWLGVSDAKLNRSLFFSFADTYWKECIEKFPTSKMAPKCYQELESSTLDAYTGSAGVFMPSDVSQDLEKYKKMIKTPI